MLRQYRRQHLQLLRDVHSVRHGQKRAQERAGFGYLPVQLARGKAASLRRRAVSAAACARRRGEATHAAREMAPLLRAPVVAARTSAAGGCSRPASAAAPVAATPPPARCRQLVRVRAPSRARRASIARRCAWRVLTHCFAARAARLQRANRAFLCRASPPDGPSYGDAEWPSSGASTRADTLPAAFAFCRQASAALLSLFQRPRLPTSPHAVMPFHSTTVRVKQALTHAPPPPPQATPRPPLQQPQPQQTLRSAPSRRTATPRS